LSYKRWHHDVGQLIAWLKTVEREKSGPTGSPFSSHSAGTALRGVKVQFDEDPAADPILVVEPA
jgi:hypothetical protein